METKVCKICGEEKPIKEFYSKGRGFTDTKCKLCQWFINNPDKKNSNWDFDKDKILIDNIINKKIQYINDLVNIIKIDLKEICKHISYDLKLNGQLKLSVEIDCEFCNKKYITTCAAYFNSEHHFCSKDCFNKFKKDNPIVHKFVGKKSCEHCGNNFEVKSHLANTQRFCSIKCKRNYYKKNPNSVVLNCDNCNKDFSRNNNQSRKYEHTFCSLDCEREYKYKEKNEIRNCIICNKSFECLKTSTVKMCSIQCQGMWQSQNLIGEKANGYNHTVSEEDRTLKCEYCTKEFRATNANRIHQRFCSDKCRQDWYSTIWSQTDEWKNESQKRAVYFLESGVFNKTNTSIQIKTNSILKELKIEYKNEKGFINCAVDNYLTDYNLIVEVMGTYWHTDNRKYSTINYEMQVNRIRMDKIKHSFIRNNYGIEILYLWETDINNNRDLCKELINQYIKNKGILKNYHSFNYMLKNKETSLIDEIIIPYMDWDIKDLHLIIDTAVKEKMSHKQTDKWTTYNCECCGKECEELTSHYYKSKKHFCSMQCASKGRLNKIDVPCDFCGVGIKVIKSKLLKNKHFFCNQDCQHKYQKQFGFKKNCKIKEFNCDNCGKLSFKKIGDYNRSNHHFCSSSCGGVYNNKHRTKNLIKPNLETA